jgi:hypothetical protein
MVSIPDGMDRQGDNMKGDIDAHQILPLFNSTEFGLRKEYLLIE